MQRKRMVNKTKEFYSRIRTRIQIVCPKKPLTPREFPLEISSTAVSWSRQSTTRILKASKTGEAQMTEEFQTRENRSKIQFPRWTRWRAMVKREELWFTLRKIAKQRPRRSRGHSPLKKRYSKRRPVILTPLPDGWLIRLSLLILESQHFMHMVKEMSSQQTQLTRCWRTISMGAQVSKAHNSSKFMIAPTSQVSPRQTASVCHKFQSRRSSSRSQYPPSQRSRIFHRPWRSSTAFWRKLQKQDRYQ